MPFKDRDKRKHNDAKRRRRQIIRRMITRISKLQEWNTDPKIDEFLETARVDLANVVNLMYQSYRSKREKPRRDKIIQLYEAEVPIKTIADKFNISTSRVNEIRKKAGLSRYRKRENKECQQQLVL